MPITTRGDDASPCFCVICICGRGSATTWIKESKLKTTASNLIRWAGLSALVAGLLFIVVQMIHPPQISSSVTTGTWAIVHYLTVAMSVLGLLGIAGIYARQVEEACWLGLAGFLLFGLWLASVMAVTFFEAFILPLLATEAPKFVHGFLGIFSHYASEVNLGALPALEPLSFVLYMFGGLLFGIATFRAGVLSRWAAGVLAVGAVSTLAFALLPHEFERLAAGPVGLGLAWLGYAVWSEQREKASQPLLGRGSPQLRQTGAK